MIHLFVTRKIHQGGIVMEMNGDKLRKAIYELKELKGVSFSEMSRASGVSNIGRIASGDITPYPDTWRKLNEAFPEDIPEPEYESGGKIYKAKAKGRGHAAGRDMTINNSRPAADLSLEEQYLINLLREKDPAKADLRRYIQEQLAKQ